ncbi:inner membrane protein YhjD [Nocardia amikacinitolerans]|uniref:inner membrane protein YhjD n=1 Tax=Nocardia amikacinitolerans TaxID=756689 RepID=UPI0020A47FCE|nr:inner membrane protein YhjD [Nocardia amikacinitolerans]MCP2289182.1 membrane protein [Nocardia amikacinitolerans]
MQAIDNIKAAVERRVQARPWLDHLIRAGGRYQRQRGDYFAAGITYFTVLSLFPLLMVAFAAAGFVLAGNPELFQELQDKVVETIPGELGTQLNDLIDQAVRSRGTVGVLGLLAGLYTGLGWMANLRAALTEQWEQKHEDGNWIRTKISDLGALIGLGLAFVVSLGLSALASSDLGAQLLERSGLADLPGARVLLTLLSILLALLASWAVFAWIIARLPREPVTVASAAKAALIAAVAFEIFKFVASIYLQIVLRSPAGAAFGSIIGLMVSSYITYRIILFATAWAATASENEPEAEVAAPAPAVIQPRVINNAGPFGSGAAYFGAGALAALGLATLRRRR